MSYIALYRKYRPQNFNNMVGQKVCIKTLQNAIKYNKIHHCYLFSGDKGIGKTTLAKIIAKAFNCLKPEKEDCCNQCESCITINQKKNLDVVEIDGASYSGVDEIRELKNTIQYKANFLKYRIYIIDEVHVLSNNAFNTLLKILEEPPLNIIFILITSEFYKIPKTVLSRTQHFHLNHIPPYYIKEKIKNIALKEKISITDEALKKISLYSNGSLRDALNLLDQINSYKNNLIQKEDIEEMLGLVSSSKIEKLFQYLYTNDIRQVISFLEDILQPNINILFLVDDLTEFLQKILINFFQLEKKEKQTNHPIVTYEEIIQLLEILNELKKNIGYSKQKKNLLIIHFIRMNKILQVTKSNPITSNIFKSKELEKNSPIIKQKEKNPNTEQKEKFILKLEKILINSDEKTKNLLMKGWKKLQNYNLKELALASSLLYKSNLLIISFQKEMILTCSEENYIPLISNEMKIKKILNTKKELIKECIVILDKDWEFILKPIYHNFLKTKNPKDLDLSNFNTYFYKKNSPINININPIIQLARDFFGFEKVKIKKSISHKE